ncbi:MAG: hypothetical protein JWM49_620 [Microbacteriaceae bacterium]|nr:hypothetical protein [Microbacteriaceae bacterium]
MSTTAPAGFYPDPAGAPARRWWNGYEWTSHYETGGAASRLTPPILEAAQPVPDVAAVGREHVASVSAPAKVTMNGRGYNPYKPARDLAAGKNTLATNALVWGIVSFLFNLFCLVGIAAIVWGIFAIQRANAWERDGHAPIGRKKAIWGIVLGGVATIATAALKGFLF